MKLGYCQEYQKKRDQTIKKFPKYIAYSRMHIALAIWMGNRPSDLNFQIYGHIQVRFRVAHCSAQVFIGKYLKSN